MERVSTKKPGIKSARRGDGGKGVGEAVANPADPRADPEIRPAVLDGLEQGDGAAMREYAQASGLLAGNDQASARATLKRYRRRKARETAPRRAPLAGPKLEAYRFARSATEEVRATIETFRGRRRFTCGPGSRAGTEFGDGPK